MKSVWRSAMECGGGAGLVCGLLVSMIFLWKNFTLFLNPVQTFLFFLLLVVLYVACCCILAVVIGVSLALLVRMRSTSVQPGDLRAWLGGTLGSLLFLLYAGRWWQVAALNTHGVSPGVLFVLAVVMLGTVVVFMVLRLVLLRAAPARRGRAARFVACAALLLLCMSLLPVLYSSIFAVRKTGKLDLDTMVRPRKGRVLFIGVDGANWKIMRPLIEEGVLPNFAKIVEEGCTAELGTFQPCYSPVIWSSIFTGKPYQEHGVFDFTATIVKGLPSIILDQADFPSYCGLEKFARLLSKLHLFITSPASSTQRKVKALWNILSEGGRSVGVVRAWASWPVEEVDGFMVSDRLYQKLTRGEGEASAESLLMGEDIYPEELLPQVLKFDRRLNDTSPEELAGFMSLSDADEERFYRIAKRDGFDPLSIFKYEYPADAFYVDAGDFLFQKYEPDFFFLYLWGTDHVQHVFWKWMEPEHFSRVREGDIEKYNRVIRNYFIWADGVLGRFTSRMRPEDTIVVCSDHGFERVEPEGSQGPHQAGHRKAPPGILIIAGPSVRRGHSLADASIMDLAPTVLYLMGFPAAEDMPGNVLGDAFREEFLASHPLRIIPTYEVGKPRSVRAARSDIDEDMKERLRALGYL